MTININKIKHKVFTSKCPNGYSVTEMTFDRDGSAVNHKIHATGISFKEAHALVKDIMHCYQ